MPIQLTVEDAKESLNAHVARKGAEIFAKYGPHLGWNELLVILKDRVFVRYPCDIVFSAEPLRDGECAHPVPVENEHPEAGFTMYVHPYFNAQRQRVPHLVLYQLVLVNYGEFVSPDDAEMFGANALGISKDEYYGILCELADEITGEQGV